MNNLSWRSIRAFIYVVDYKSFTAAAAATGFSKANLSQQVTDLEAALGVQLLIRTTRQLRLTDIGKGYYKRCKDAMTQLDSAAEWAATATGLLKGIIRINSVGGPVGEDIIAPLAIDFQRQNPGIEIHLDFSSVRVDLIEDHYDLVIRMGDLPDSRLIMRTLHTVTTRYVASPDFLKQHGAITCPQQLASLPLIRGSVDHWLLVRETEQHTIFAETGMKVISGRAMRHAALAGLGVTRLADLYVQADLTRGDLIEILPNWSEKTPLSIICPPLRYQQTRVRAFIDWLQQNVLRNYQKALESPNLMS